MYAVVVVRELHFISPLGSHLDYETTISRACYNKTALLCYDDFFFLNRLQVESTFTLLQTQEYCRFYQRSEQTFKLAQNS